MSGGAVGNWIPGPPKRLPKGSFNLNGNSGKLSPLFWAQDRQRSILTDLLLMWVSTWTVASFILHFEQIIVGTLFFRERRKISN